ncbi:bifunctional phosphopantothenoylcysteine decarboxylase/phosphopantothenate--cysteine ligase CoaBC [Proteiniclasticum sp. BAD-10]|uniref:Coenzyme A biosynthesis bifunctional protein CoaBC n=1 Tax=Proteiniclasticum sediminis TaxID=2804028 RepID=A0A941HPK2_9CLOT|nr:bifunctional phosphopantothenoylcysteine decarboxylase/phosphopantothenate--cysteine ligase CoaBC [Proteiniclasticum sediminis]MBR0575429.1 bifunctional phosphopantothenoylcysteine decarboxylase/phosphopantothenate--cysteine ligase CoaBC [Proteiniclasticum sediminis]
MKNVVLGVTGGIAAYKALEVVSRLKKLGINVDVAMSKSAQEFVTPLTFQSLSQNPVITDMFDEPKAFEIAHISLAKKADVFAIVPATANIIGKIAHGISDDFITTSVMATKAKVLIAPAMNTQMYANPLVQENIEKLKGLGYHFVSPGAGRLACGDVGEGKLALVDDIMEEILALLHPRRDWAGRQVLITAGGTEAPIDPVRVLTNHSSGKMGIALAEVLRDRGAQVTLIHARVTAPLPQGVELVEARTVEAMDTAVQGRFAQADAVFMAAAVSDYQMKEVSPEKIKKSGDTLTLELVKAKDILKSLGEEKTHQILVGFAAESQELEKNAQEKLVRKNLDFIAANNISGGQVFGQEENHVVLYGPHGLRVDLGQRSKKETAEMLVDEVTKHFQK